MKSFRTMVLIAAILMLAVVAATVAIAQTYTDVYNFDWSNGSGPEGVLAQGRDGNLYGTTQAGGSNNRGVAFVVTPGGRGKVVYNFDDVDGATPRSGLTLGTDGNLYGTAQLGGENSYGTIFKITAGGRLTTLHSFTGIDGSLPLTAPAQGADGSFYGVTSNGILYKISSSGVFTEFGPIPGQSTAPLFLATDGNFYGTVVYGGANDCGNGYGCGDVFRMTPKGVVITIYNFDGTTARYPWGPVIQGSDGNFYGTTYAGGTYGGGVVYKLTAQGAMTVLHNFGDPNYPNDGATPYTGLVQATDGNYYGVTDEGGTSGWGVIFQITPAGGYSVLHNFDGYKGQNPLTPPLQHTNGKIYGLAISGGSSQQGVVYSLDMGIAPFVRLVFPAGKVGQTGGILGQGFTGTTSVSLNGTPVTFTVVSDTYIKATVPAGATTGYVAVTTPTGVLTSNVPFRVIP